MADGTDYDLHVLDLLPSTKPEQYLYDIFLICPVRNATEEQNRAMTQYVSDQEAAGKIVYWPRRDTNQVDPSGIRICRDNAYAMLHSREVHVFYDGESQGSRFDLGVAFGLKRPIILVNPGAVKRTPSKSFENVVSDLDSIYRARM